MDSCFSELHNLIEGLTSKEDFDKAMLQAVVLISKLNKAYIDVSTERNRLATIIQTFLNTSSKLEQTCDSCMYDCHVLSEEIENVILPEVDVSKLDILSEEDYIKEASISEEDRELIPPNKFLKQRLNFEVNRYKEIMEEYQKLNERSAELKKRLSSAQKVFAPIIMKLKDMDGIISEFLDNTTL